MKLTVKYSTYKKVKDQKERLKGELERIEQNSIELVESLEEIKEKIKVKEKEIEDLKNELIEERKKGIGNEEKIKELEIGLEKVRENLDKLKQQFIDSQQNIINKLLVQLQKTISESKLQDQLIEEGESEKKLVEEVNSEDLWSELETYFLARELTKEEVGKIYEDVDFENIIRQTVPAEVETSRKIFKAVVNIVASKKILKITESLNNDIKLLVDDYVDMIRKSWNELDLTISTEERKHPLYLSLINNDESTILFFKQKSVKINEKEMIFCQETCSGKPNILFK